MSVVQRISGLSVSDVVKYFPALLNPLYVYSVYYMVQRGSNDNKLASLSAMITAIGPSTAVLSFASNLANILGLSLAFVSLGCLFSYSKSEDRTILWMAIISFSLIGLTHPWTLYQYLVALGLVVIFYYYSFKFSGSGRGRGLESFLVVVILLESFRILLTSTYLGAPTSPQLPSLSHLMTFPKDSFNAVVWVYGGLISNPILLGLSVIGCLSLKTDGFFPRYLRSLVAVTSIAYLFMDVYAMNRLVLNLPLGILAAMGLNHLSTYTDEPWERRAITIFLFVTLISILLGQFYSMIPNI
jgi:hypothetical protein